MSFKNFMLELISFAFLSALMILLGIYILNHI
jgi:hypothetical protein